MIRNPYFGPDSIVKFVTSLKCFKQLAARQATPTKTLVNKTRPSIR